MPKIPLLRDKKKKKSRPTYSTDKKKKRDAIYHNKRWQSLRDQHLHLHPYCECCYALNYWKSGEDVHHIVSVNDDETLAYEPNNLQTLCKFHHSYLHTLKEFKNRLRKDGIELAEWLKENKDKYKILLFNGY